MAISGFLFLSWRLFEIVFTTPIVGMLSYIVHQLTERNIIVPTFILVMFIVSVLALAWEVFTVVSYLRARHDAYFIALVDIGFFGAFIAGVVLLRHFGGANCGHIYIDVNSSGAVVSIDDNKWCSLLKASFALGIINVIAFFITFWLALLVAHHHRNDDRVVVKREYHSSRHNQRRSGSRDYRGSRDGRPRSSGRSQYSNRRNYYV